MFVNVITLLIIAYIYLNSQLFNILFLSFFKYYPLISEQLFPLHVSLSDFLSSQLSGEGRTI